MVRSLLISLSVALASVLGFAPPTSAGTIVDEWQSVKPPPAPALKEVTLEPKATALLVLDVVKQTCNSEKRPRCVASLPRIADLIARARAQGVFLIYATVPPTPVADTVSAVAPVGNEPVVTAWVDKFMLGDKDTGLDKMLKDRGVTTIAVVGTAAHGAVLYTSSAASLRGYKVVVPVDGMSSDTAYAEQYVAYQLAAGPAISTRITLTRTDMIRF